MVHGPSMRPGLACGLLLLATACTGQSFELGRESVAGVAPGPRISHDPAPGTAVWMARHFADVLEIQRAVIAGDLLGVRAPARRLVERTDPYPESWRPFVAGNLRLAESALTARSLADAAQAAAGLANNCGECHEAVGLGPGLGAAAPPSADASDAPLHMLRHQWAAERMSDALVSHGDAAWRAGAEALTDAPLRPTILPTDVNHPAAFDALAEQVHELGARARTAASWSDRAVVYGELLTTCAACHRELMTGRFPYLARTSSGGGVE